MAAADIAVINISAGITFQRPLMLRMSRLPVAWSTIPAIMNRGALNRAWHTRWKSAAAIAISLPMPISRVISPRWEMVE